MMGNHSVIEHKANYHYIKVEEDYIAICTKGETSPHCKAMILSVLESWTNTKRAESKSPYVYMTYEQWEKSLYNWYKRDVIMACLEELETNKLIASRQIKAGGKLTYEYCLNIGQVQAHIKDLPGKEPDEHAPRLDWEALKKRRVEKSTATHRKIDSGRVEKSTAQAQKPSKNRRILESDSKLPILESGGKEPPANEVPASSTPPPEKPSSSKVTFSSLRKQWIAEWGPYGDAKWDNDALKWIANEGGSFDDIKLLYEVVSDKRPEKIKNAWYRLSALKNPKGPPVGGRRFSSYDDPNFRSDEDFYPVEGGSYAAAVN